MKHRIALVAVVAVLLNPEGGIAFDRGLHSPCEGALVGNVRLADKLFGDEPSPERLRAWYATPGATDMVLVSLLPTTAGQYQSVFERDREQKRPIGATAEREVAQVAAATAPRTGFIRARSWAAASDLIKTRKESIVVLLAHSDADRLATADGKDTAIFDILEACTNANKLCVIVACKSAASINAAPPPIAAAGIGLVHDIDMNAALNLVRRLKAAIERDDTTTPAIVKKTVARLESRGRIITFAQSAICHGIEAVVAGFIIYEVRQLDGETITGTVIDSSSTSVRLTKQDDGSIVGIAIDQATQGDTTGLATGTEIVAVCRRNGTSLIAKEIRRLGR